MRPTPPPIEATGTRFEMGLKVGLGSHPSDSCAKVCDKEWDRVCANRVVCDCRVANTKKNRGFSEIGSGGRDRTYDQLINSQLLYR